MRKSTLCCFQCCTSRLWQQEDSLMDTTCKQCQASDDQHFNSPFSESQKKTKRTTKTKVAKVCENDFRISHENFLVWFRETALPRRPWNELVKNSQCATLWKKVVLSVFAPININNCFVFVCVFNFLTKKGKKCNILFVFALCFWYVWTSFLRFRLWPSHCVVRHDENVLWKSDNDSKDHEGVHQDGHFSASWIWDSHERRSVFWMRRKFSTCDWHFRLSDANAVQNLSWGHFSSELQKHSAPVPMCQTPKGCSGLCTMLPTKDTKSKRMSVCFHTVIELRVTSSNDLHQATLSRPSFIWKLGQPAGFIFHADQKLQPGFFA